jgi:hypothetical protein
LRFRLYGGARWRVAELIIHPFKIYYVEATGGFQPEVPGVDFAAPT